MLLNIKGKDKAEILKSLYNASRPFGAGFIQYDPTPMEREEAEELLKHSTYFDYLRGRLMKVELGNDTLDTQWYDRDLGEGAGEYALRHLLKEE